MTENRDAEARLKAAEQSWMARSDEEDFFFALHHEPRKLRRSRRFPGALSALQFGVYEDMQNQAVQDNRVVWLSMIVSESPGDGSRLLGALTLPLAKQGLALMGTPTALRPRDWDAERKLHTEVDLIRWYMKHGFRVIQNGSQTRLVHCPHSLALETSFRLENKQRGSNPGLIHPS